MQRLFREVTEIDILESITIASACMKHFRAHHLQPQELAIIPEMGYETRSNQSKLARKFLRWYASTKNVEVHDCDSDGGEKRIYTNWLTRMWRNGGENKFKSFLLDGYVQQPDKDVDLAIEVHG
jgi:hypothetical protein